MKTIGSFVCCRNGRDLGYCWEEAALSLLPVCDELILCDSDSTDGTREAMERFAERHPKTHVINWPWPNPKGDSHHFFIKWLNFAREHLTADMCLYLDADEVLDDSPECHQAIRECADRGGSIFLDRLNLWRDPLTAVPEGECCGKWCARMGPREYECVSDEPRHRGERKILDEAVREPRAVIWHLGFLRNRDAFYRKARAVLGQWFNRYDERLELGESQGKQLWETECSFTDRLQHHNRRIPDMIQKWLSGQGHMTEKYLPIIPDEPQANIEINETPSAEILSVLHGGDLGDVVYAMAVYRAIGGVNLFAYDQRHVCKRLLHRLPALQPLLESQDYIKSVKVHDGEPIDWNSSLFRNNHQYTHSLVRSHQLHYLGQRQLPRISLDVSTPWLRNITPSPISNGRVVINKTMRYPNQHFKWKEVLDHYGKLCLFVGLPEEHHHFQKEYGEIEFIQTKDLLEVAQIIAGASLTVANQSVALAMAEGLKAPRIACICIYQPDVCIQRGDPTVQRSADGACLLPAIGDVPEKMIPPVSGMMAINKGRVPPNGGWRHGNLTHTHFSALQYDISQRRKISMEEAEKEIIAQTVATSPEFFRLPPNTDNIKFSQALENAQ